MDKYENEIFLMNDFINEIALDFDRYMIFAEKYVENLDKEDLKIIRHIFEELVFITLIKTFYMAVDIFEKHGGERWR